jgi:hypothetical protein
MEFLPRIGEMLTIKIVFWRKRFFLRIEGCFNHRAQGQMQKTGKPVPNPVVLSQSPAVLRPVKPQILVVDKNFVPQE